MKKKKKKTVAFLHLNRVQKQTYRDIAKNSHFFLYSSPQDSMERWQSPVCRKLKRQLAHNAITLSIYVGFL